MGGLQTDLIWTSRPLGCGIVWRIMISIEMRPSMSEVEQIESRIKSLSQADLAKLRSWFIEFDAQAWDRQLESDSAAGRLDALMEESISEHEAGKSRVL